MKLMFVSENQTQVALMKQCLKGSGIKFVHIGHRDTVKSALANEEFLAIVLDFPNPSDADFYFWVELREFTDKPVLLLSSDQSDPERMAARQLATVQLAEPLLNFLYAVNGREADKQSNFRGSSLSLAENVEIDFIQRCIIRDEKVYPLTKREFQVLLPLIQRMGTPVTAKELLDLAWVEEHVVSISNLYHYIRKLRGKLESNPGEPKILLTDKKKDGGFMLRDKGKSLVTLHSDFVWIVYVDNLRKNSSGT